MKLVVGLGNPGKKYADTRHNAGFMVIDKLISPDAKSGSRPAVGTISKQISKLKSQISIGEINKNKIIIIKPQTYMNESGAAARAVTDFYKIKSADLIVIHDDKDILLGEYKIQTNRGPAGHNGVISIIKHLGTQNFTRVRVGIKPAGEIKDTADFVLKKFTKKEHKIIDEIIDKIVDDIKKILS